MQLVCPLQHQIHISFPFFSPSGSFSSHHGVKCKAVDLHSEGTGSPTQCLRAKDCMRGRQMVRNETDEGGSWRWCLQLLRDAYALLPEGFPQVHGPGTRKHQPYCGWIITVATLLNNTMMVSKGQRWDGHIDSGGSEAYKSPQSCSWKIFKIIFFPMCLTRIIKGDHSFLGLGWELHS